jgi:hypothetical protein
MHLFMLLPLLLQPSAPPDLDARIAALTASAAAHHDAGAYAAAANDYLKLASLPRADGETALKQAHLNLDAAFVQTSDVVHLCHALGVARRRIAMGGFKSDQARLSWEERAADDEARLAAVDGRCPSASASPPPQLLDVASSATPPRDELPTPTAMPAGRASVRLDRVGERRRRARTAAGATLTGLGLGFGGLMGLTLALHVQQLAALRKANDVPDGFTYPTSDQSMLAKLHDDARLTQAASIGLGVASAVVLGTGIGLLASRRRAPRSMALVPHGGRHGGGVMLRLRF